MANVRHPSYPAAPLVTVFMILVVAWFALLATFYSHPTIDIDISSAFFSGPVCAKTVADGACGYFPLRRIQLFEEVRRALYILPYFAAALILITGLVGVISREVRQYVPMGRLLVALISLGVGPGLVVNLLLKAHSGRPRPVQTNLFGGPLDFAAAGTFAGECARNCSFVSGEASGAGWLICLLFIVPANARSWVAPPLVIASATMAALRVAVGSHYVSDALLGWLLAVIVFMGMLIVENRISAGWSSRLA
ncbi:phosphatase PAP2 family protein [Rhizobium sp. BK176]|uniref:phosphatase PAP2 family protein n=1 Tax=Rhizobium sp. BK176 TaxID=2587071 RepID=UPI002168FC36|nr:phosphatase PAP2 family protein [Rhizobium sp. BK176]MCS4093573.1 membrane-associated phospholipid phosphatase [Rhizobium sp. BK176]